MSARIRMPFALKALASGAILAIVLTRVDRSAVIGTLSQAELIFFFLGTIIALPVLFTGVQRWRCVAATFGETLPLAKAFMYTSIGQFINLGLPTAVGLDSVRAWKMHQQGISIGLAARIVIIDRLCSLFTLLIIVALGMCNLSGLRGSEIFKHSAMLTLVFGTASIGVLTTVQWWGRHIPPSSRAKHLYQLSKDFNDALFANKVWTIKIISWSACNHLCRVAIVLFLALALGISLAASDAFTLVPVALLICMIPISIAGWGVRELVFIQAFSLAGVAPSHAFALSLLYGLVDLITGLLGGVVWFIERKLQKLSIAPSK